MSSHHAFGLYNRERTGSRYKRTEEFQEEDIWGVLKESDSMTDSYKEHFFVSKPVPSAARMIPRSNKSSNSHEPKIIHHSAPVNIADWSKIYGASSKHEPSWLDTTDDHNGNGYHDHGLVRSSWESDEEDDGDDGNIIPPHEWIARKLAGKQISSFSVCEGVGRTLKGRDLRRVRNAVLTKTGFLE